MKNTQIILCVVIGFIAAFTVAILKTKLEFVNVAQAIELPRQMLLDAYKVQIHLIAFILQTIGAA